VTLHRIESEGLLESGARGAAARVRARAVERTLPLRSCGDAERALPAAQALV